MTEEQPELSPEELEEQKAQELPDREEMSTLRGVQPLPIVEPLPPVMQAETS